jgi:glycosyltransferase involved in cell wall biosynthesis
MAAADVFVLPSYREGFGSVIIEAAACGIPSIAYRIDGVIDAIVDGRTGLFVDKGDVRGLSDAMNRLGAESRMRKTLGEAAHLRASSEFSSASVSKAWLDFYLSVLRGKA